MKAGTLEPFVETKTAPKGGRRMSATTPRKGGGGGTGGPNDSGNNPQFPEYSEPVQNVVDKSKLITGFLLLAIGMTFAGLIGAYVVLATNKAMEWKPFEMPYQIWISTIVILASSLTYEMARRAVERAEVAGSRRWFVATTALGGIFVASQIIVWLDLVNRGFYMRANPYAGFFYILTAAHLVHVAAGIAALGSILLRSWYPSYSDAESTRRNDLARSIGWYWHFMAILWVVLFVTLAFWL